RSPCDAYSAPPGPSAPGPDGRARRDREQSIEAPFARGETRAPRRFDVPNHPSPGSRTFRCRAGSEVPPDSSVERRWSEKDHADVVDMEVRSTDPVSQALTEFTLESDRGLERLTLTRRCVDSAR